MQRLRLLLPRRGQHLQPLKTLVVAAVALFGCSPGDDGGVDSAHACTLAFIGDPSKPVELQIIARGADGTSKVIDDGSDVAIIYPPQGGRVIFAGARATNLDPCRAKLTGALRDPSTHRVAGVDIRSPDLTPTGDGWGASLDADISSFSNIAVCPNQWASTDVFDHVFQLELTVVDRSGRKASKTIQVTPRCAEPDREAECRCICRAGYVLGQVCAASDAGVDANDAAEGG